MLQFMILLFLLLIPFSFCQSNTIIRQINIDLSANHHCYRILNATHQFGCQSDLKGSTGVIHVITKLDDLDFVRQDQSRIGPYIVAVFANVFVSKKFIPTLTSTPNVAGVLLLHQYEKNVQIEPFSEDQTCPNIMSSFYFTKNRKSIDDSVCSSAGGWNPSASNFRFLDLRFPVFYMRNQTDISMIVDWCFGKVNKNKSTYPYCAADLKTFHFAAHNAVTCQRRSESSTSLSDRQVSCDPISDWNVFGMMPKPILKTENISSKSIILLVTRMDSFSAFQDAAPGVHSSTVNVITMLSIAHTLQSYFKDASYAGSRRILIGFLNGESLDYIGSSRMLWDMEQKKFPSKLDENLHNQSALIDLSNVELIVELNQLMPSSAGNIKYVLHSETRWMNQSSRDLINKISQQLINRFSRSGSISIDTPGVPLPPSSLHSFLKIDNTIPHILLNNARQKFIDPFYNSFLDTLSKQEVDSKAKVLQILTGLVDTVSNTVIDRLLMANDSSKQYAKVDTKIVSLLFDCFTQWPVWNCTCLQRLLRSMKAVGFARPTDINDIRSQTYIGVGSSGIRNYVHYLLSFIMGRRIPCTVESASQCTALNISGSSDSVYTYRYMEDLFSTTENQSFCVESSVFTTMAKSPAFEIDGYSLAENPKSFPTWMESRWEKIGLKLFLIANPLYQLVVFGVGFFVLMFFMLWGCLISKDIDTLFENTFSLQQDACEETPTHL